jgi:hypothetical protein
LGNPVAKWLALITLAAYIIALFFGIMAVRPRRYTRSHHGLDRLRYELDRILTHKSRWFLAGLICLFIGTLALAALVIIVIWPI